MQRSCGHRETHISFFWSNCWVISVKWHLLPLNHHSGIGTCLFSSDFQAVTFMGRESQPWFSPFSLWDPIYFFQTWSLDQRLVNYGPWAKSNWLLVFENKVLLKYSQAHLYMCCLGLLSWKNSRVERCDGDCVALYRKSALTPSLDDSWTSGPQDLALTVAWSSSPRQTLSFLCVFSPRAIRTIFSLRGNDLEVEKINFLL